MHRRVVQRIGRAGNAEEAGALLEGLGAQARHLLELFPAGKIAVLFAVCDNSLGQRRANTRHILQQVRAGSIDSHPHAVHAAFYGIVQLFLEEPLVYVVLILPNAQGLGVYLHQFCQRVHQATADRNGTAYGDIVFREFLPSYLGGRIHGSAILAHGENAHAFRQPHHPHKNLRLPSGGSGADGNYLYIILFHQIGHGGNGLYLFGHGRMRENDVVVQEVPLRIQTDHLATGTEARVDGHYALLPNGRRQQELTQIFPKHLDGRYICLFLGFPQHFSGDGRVQQALPGIFHGLTHLQAGLPLGISLCLAKVVIHLVGAFFPIGIYFYTQEALLLGAQHGQQVVGRNFTDGHGEVEIAAVFGGIRAALPCLGHLGGHAAGTVNATQVLADECGLAQAFRHNVAGALQSLFHVLDLPFHETAGIGPGILRLAAPQEVCQRFQTFGDSKGGAGFPLGPERKIQIFQLAAADAVFYLLFKFCGKFILLRDGFEDGGLALFHLFKDIGPMFDLCHLYVREAAGALFAVAADKGNGAAVPEQFHAVFHLPGLNAQKLGDMLDVSFFHIFKCTIFCVFLQYTRDTNMEQVQSQAPSWWWTIVNILFLIELLPLALLFLGPYLLYERAPRLLKPFYLFIGYYAKVLRETVLDIRSLLGLNPEKSL